MQLGHTPFYRRSSSLILTSQGLTLGFSPCSLNIADGFQDGQKNHSLAKLLLQPRTLSDMDTPSVFMDTPSVFMDTPSVFSGMDTPSVFKLKELFHDQKWSKDVYFEAKTENKFENNIHQNHENFATFLQLVKTKNRRQTFLQ